MAASGYTWAGKKLTPKELNNSQRSDPLPLVAKVTQVTSEYEKSCPQLTSGTVLWVYGSTEEERVALKTTTDRNPKYISIPLDAPIRFEVVYTHERGPPTFLSSLLKGKVQSELRVEMAGNTGNRLSSTPDQTQSVPYGILQVVGIYKETVLRTQTITNVSGELNSLRRNLSVNCPISLDVATGLYGKSADEFQKLKTRLRQNQSTGSGNQAETSSEIFRLSSDFSSIDDAHLLAHVSCLHVSRETDRRKTVLPPKVQPKPEPKSAKSKVTTPKEIEQEVLEPITDPDSEMTVLVYESFEWMNRDSNVTSGDPLHFPDIGESQDVRQPIYVNMPMKVPPELDKEPYLNEDEIKSVIRGKKRIARSSEKIDSVYELPKHCSYVKGVRPAAGKGKGIESEETVETTVQKLSMDLKETELQENDSEKVEYETAMSIEPILREWSRTGKEKISPSSRTDKTTSEDRSKRKKNVTDFPSIEKEPLDRPSKEKSVRFQSRETTEHHPKGEELRKKHSSTTFMSSTTSLSAQASIEEEEETGENLITPSTPTASSLAAQPKSRKDNQILKGLAGIGRKLKDSVSSGIAARRDSNDKDTGGDAVWASMADVPKDIRSFTIDQVSLCLRLLNLGQYEERFRARKIDGACLREINQSSLVQSFQMEELEAKQLVMFARNQWRPR